VAINAFTYLTLGELAALRATYLACITAIGEGHQSYSLNGISVTRATLNEAKTTLGEIGAAIALLSGTAQRRAYPIVRPYFT